MLPFLTHSIWQGVARRSSRTMPITRGSALAHVHTKGPLVAAPLSYFDISEIFTQKEKNCLDHELPVLLSLSKYQNTLLGGQSALKDWIIMYFFSNYLLSVSCVPTSVYSVYSVCARCAMGGVYGPVGVWGEDHREILKDTEIENNSMAMEFGSFPYLLTQIVFQTWKEERRTTFIECLLYAKLCARRSTYNYLNIQINDRYYYVYFADK